jgi:hypothetical protein
VQAVVEQRAGVVMHVEALSSTIPMAVVVVVVVVEMSILLYT